MKISFVIILFLLSFKAFSDDWRSYAQITILTEYQKSKQRSNYERIEFGKSKRFDECNCQIDIMFYGHESSITDMRAKDSGFSVDGGGITFRGYF